jgi:hypothetical protein
VAAFILLDRVFVFAVCANQRNRCLGGRQTGWRSASGQLAAFIQQGNPIAHG